MEGGFSLSHFGMKSWVAICGGSDSDCQMLPPSFSLRFVFILSMGLLPLVSLDAQNFPTTVTARDDAASYLKPLNQRGVVKYNTIAGDFTANQVASIGKYSGKRITVVGRVAHLSLGNSENYALVVTIQDASASLPAVKCKFLSDAFPQNSDLEISTDGSEATLVMRHPSGTIIGKKSFLSVDQLVAIKGVYKEIKVGDIVLTDCKIIPKERLHELRDELKKQQKQ
jgi:hypothetical protein